MAVSAMRVGAEAEPMKKVPTFRKRRDLRRVQFDPEAFDLDPTDRVTIIVCLIVLGLLVGGLWLLR